LVRECERAAHSGGATDFYTLRGTADTQSDAAAGTACLFWRILLMLPAQRCGLITDPSGTGRNND
jgi:hypothetical protein